METSLDLRQWAVVKSFGSGYIGRFFDPAEVAEHDRDKPIEEQLLAARSSVLLSLRDGIPIKLHHAFDYFTPVRQIPRGDAMAIARDPIVLPIDFCLEPTPFYAVATSVYFLGDLSEGDAKDYRTFLMAAINNAQMARASRVGLDLKGHLPQLRSHGGA